jgi:hypothetical protein
MMSNAQRLRRLCGPKAAYLADAHYAGPVDPTPLTEAMDIIDHGTEFRLARDHFASLPVERQAQLRAEWE